MFERGKIVLVPFPFTDLSSEKLRPAVIISDHAKISKDVIVAFISSKIINIDHLSVIIDEKDKTFKKTGLKKTSLIRTDKIATLDKKIVLGELGEIHSQTEKEMNKRLKLAMKL